MSNETVDLYLADGCGRCPRYRTAECSTQLWRDELKMLRNLALSTGLTEESKWSHPCYTDSGKNIAVLGAFRDCCVITFFKGALLLDPARILELPGENSQAARVIRIRGIDHATALIETIRDYLREAVLIERSGQQVEHIKIEDRPIPQELAAKFDEMPGLRDAFNALTPGRQRFYLMQFSQPKQANTREKRIEKSIDNIMAGKGYREV